MLLLCFWTCFPPPLWAFYPPAAAEKKRVQLFVVVVIVLFGVVLVFVVLLSKANWFCNYENDEDEEGDEKGGRGMVK